MKKALNLLFAYFVFLIGGIIAGTFVYNFYLNVIQYVTGNEIDLFNKADLFESFFFISYCTIFLICPIVSYYRIRHPAGISQTIAYCIICVITWGLLLPGVYKIENICTQKFQFVEHRTPLSSGYFRKVDNKIYYFTKDFQSSDYTRGETSTIIIDTSENGKVNFENVKDYDTAEFNRKAKPFREIMIKKTFSEKTVSIPIDFNLIIMNAKKSMDGGLISFLFFLSISLIICSLYGLTNFFDWKLLNSVLLFFGVMLIFLINTSYYLPVFDAVKFKITNNNFFHLLGRFTDEPLLFVINIFFMISFIVIGIVKFAVHKHGKKE